MPATAHLSDEVLLSLTFEGTLPSEDEALHLAGCEVCGAQREHLWQLAQSLAAFQRAEPGNATLAAYQSLFSHVRQADAFNRFAHWVRATLALDTRQMSVTGVRGTAAAAYRLLYTTDAADVELMIEPASGAYRVVGELLPLHQETVRLPALIHFEQDGGTVAEVETNESGHFQLATIQPGLYRLWIAFADGGDIVIEDLEIG